MNIHSDEMKEKSNRNEFLLLKDIAIDNIKKRTRISKLGILENNKVYYSRLYYSVEALIDGKIYQNSVEY